MDERFLMHRLKSTSLAGVVGGLGLGGLSFYYLITQGELRHDLFAILCVMAAVKVGAIVCYRRMN